MENAHTYLFKNIRGTICTTEGIFVPEKEAVRMMEEYAELVKNHGVSHHIKDRLTEFINNQEDIDPEIAKVIDEKFWDLL